MPLALINQGGRHQSYSQETRLDALKHEDRGWIVVPFVTMTLTPCTRGPMPVGIKGAIQRLGFFFKRPSDPRSIRTFRSQWVNSRIGVIHSGRWSEALPSGWCSPDKSLIFRSSCSRSYLVLESVPQRVLGVGERLDWSGVVGNSCS